MQSRAPGGDLSTGKGLEGGLLTLKMEGEHPGPGGLRWLTPTGWGPTVPSPRAQNPAQLSSLTCKDPSAS